MPERGRIGVFNRSYYEEVLVVRVHPEILAAQRLPPDCSGEPEVWAERFKDINRFEKYLHRNGVRIIKLFLHISKAEQRKRFLARIDQSEKNWKFSSADVAERRLWDRYQEAFDDMLRETSTEDLPWHVIPADRKWFARAAAGSIIVDVLRELDPRYPELSEQRRRELAEARKLLEAEDGKENAKR
jgi:polyphosphate kinase 2 (PPK2 family)